MMSLKFAGFSTNSTRKFILVALTKSASLADEDTHEQTKLRDFLGLFNELC
jgi:hypothetical protein